MTKQRQRSRRIWRRIRSIFWTAAFLLVISAAVLTGLGRLLAPYANHLNPRLSAYLSEQLETPVSINEVSAGWDGSRPHLQLEGVAVGAAGDALQLQQVRLQFDPLTWFRPERNSLRMEISGAELILTRSSAAEWSLMGLGNHAGDDQQQTKNITTLLRRVDMQLVDARIQLKDQVTNYARMILLPQVSIAQVPEQQNSSGELPANTGSRFQLAARLQPDGDQDAEAVLRLLLHADNELQSMQGYFRSQRQSLQPWMAIMPEAITSVINNPAEAEAELWFDWRRDQQLEVTGHIQLSGSFPDQQPAAFMAADVNAQFDQGQWALELENLAFDRDSLSGTWLEVGSNADDEKHHGWSIAAGSLPLEQLQTWQQWLLPEASQKLKLQGQLQGLKLAMDRQGKVLLAEFKGDEIYLDSSRLGAAEQTTDSLLCGPLSLELVMQQQLGALNISSQAGLCDIPGFTKAPYPVEQLELKLILEQHGRNWFAHAQSGHWDSGDFDLQMGGHAAWVNDRIWLDIHAGIGSILATQVKNYLPYQEQPKGANEWISRSMLGGYWRDVSASLRGYPENWPLEPEHGQLVAGVTLDSVDLNYGRNWPVANQVEARVVMQGDQLETTSADGSVSGIPVSDLTIQINDIVADPILELTAQMDTDAAAVLDLLAIMPLGGTRGLAERDFELEGPVLVTTSLALDLRQRSRLIWAQGKAELQQLTAKASLLTVSGIEGNLGFDESGIVDSQLQALWGGHESKLRWVTTDEGPEIHLQGHYPAQHIVATALPEQPYVRQLISGESEWLLRLLISRDIPRVLLSTDLMGTELRMPAPLEKFSADSKLLAIDWELGGGERNIAIDYADILRLRMLQQASRDIAGANAQFRLPGVLAPPPPTVELGKVMLSGQTAVFDPLGWMGMASNIVGTTDAGDIPVQNLVPELHLDAEQLVMDRRVFGNTRLDYTERLVETLEGLVETQRVLQLDGESVEGEVSFAISDHSWVIDTNLKRLDVPKPLVTNQQSSGHEMLIEERPPVLDEERIDWLTLHLICDDLTWHGIPLGQTRVEILPRFDGMVIDTLEARSDVLTLTGSGGWRRTDKGVSSNLKLRLDTDNTGDLLEAMDYERLVEGSQLTLMLESSWPGSIGELSLQRMDGKLTIEAGAGVIPQAAPGAGRVLGLISLQALPRRLFLDFSDVFAEGLDFDRAGGILVFHAGIARTSGIVINSAAAKISITGETDLIRGEYDQLVTVEPGVSVALPLLGAIAGGPIGAGAGFALQGLLGGSFGGLAEIKYAVTGPWAEPHLRAIADAPTVNRVEPDSRLPGMPQESAVQPLDDNIEQPQGYK